MTADRIKEGHGQRRGLLLCPGGISHVMPAAVTLSVRVKHVDKNQLYYGDNLNVLRHYVNDESVDLVYLDPPFNSNRNYSVIFNRNGKVTDANSAQIEAFEDTWHWTHTTEQQFTDFIDTAPGRIADAVSAFRTLVGENDAMAYIVNMAPRLVQLHRALKPTGSLYLHCDPTMSHYLKLILDAIFGPEHFRNEIIWNRTAAKGLSSTRLANNHDVILCYAKGPKSKWKSSEAFIPYDMNALDEKTSGKYKYDDGDGRLYRLSDITNPNPDRPNLTYEFMGMTKVWRWTKDRMEKASRDGIIVQTAPGRIPQMKRYLDEQRGRPLSDVWTDISPLNSQAAERLGYPTQKPLALLERIVKLATDEGDVVLDPFCGCGTTVDAAQRLNRNWIGIDITYIAIDLILKRLEHTYGRAIRSDIDVNGIPSDLGSAQALFERSAFDFERWAVSLINAEPNQKQVGDRGIDGTARFPLGGGKLGKVLVSVKGGKMVTPSFARDLRGTVERTRDAHMGILITMGSATRGVQEEMDHGGVFTHPANGQTFPKMQHVSVSELLSGEMPKMPGTLLPYIQAEKIQSKPSTDSLF